MSAALGRSTGATLEVEGLRVGFGAMEAVRGIDLTVARGETHCLVGESGCGKSATALAIMGLLPRGARRTARRIGFAGSEIGHLPERKLAALRGDRIGMIFQDPMSSLNPAYTIGSQMTEVLRRHRGVARDKAAERAVAMLDRVGVTAPGMRLGQFPHQLSGGLRQRVMIAMALLCEPELLIADEPTTALDVTVQAQTLRLLAELQRELGLAVLLITHDLGIVARVAHRVSVMYAGEIVEQASTDALFAAPHPSLHARPAGRHSRARQGAPGRSAGQHPRPGAAHCRRVHGLRLSGPVRPRDRGLHQQYRTSPGQPRA